MRHLYSKRSLFNCSVTCRSFAHVADELAVELRGVPAQDLPRALRRFDRAVAAAVERPAGSYVTLPVFSNEADNDAYMDAFVTFTAAAAMAVARAAQAKAAAAAAAELAAALRSIPAAHSARIERLRIVGYPGAAKELATAAAAGRWPCLQSLELAGVSKLPWSDLAAAVRALPALEQLTVRGVDDVTYDQEAVAAADVAAADVAAADAAATAADAGHMARSMQLESKQLRSLELSDCGSEAVTAILAHLNQLRPSSNRQRLKRLVIANVPDLASVSLQGLQGLEVSACGFWGASRWGGVRTVACFP